MSPPTCSSNPASNGHTQLPLAIAATGVRLAVRLTPRAGKERIDGVLRLADGQPALKVAVAAPPAVGRANAALLDLLAREWRLRRSDLAIAAGHKSRNKIVHIAGDPDTLWRHLSAALSALP